MTSKSKEAASATPLDIVKEQFGRRLYELMLEKGWTQSEMGRQADIPRDGISSYVRGRALPTRQNLTRLARALSVPESDLLPSRIRNASDPDGSEVSVRISPDDPTRAWLRVNQLVSREASTRIQEILANDRAFLAEQDRQRSSS
ncbi:MULTISPECIES: helix-turn-helix transcriptional regulator [Methylobacterium]|jgi:transcriptional regulator with XRE-family HTH domain|uniref:helix-turn-helix domain-containing protein n=1 Tax=Methylobacterium TaxID=407 RepID=UPI000B8A1593|nr:MULTISPECIES: helix-turn-helix transcriptional regulator [Methylobacterium]MBK3397641.1 helix-turn-helix transcriptional regulator [Methylobacterium ajmalii]MBK3412504.1 helix-turn-helix transcriptional regulator [Methylobacterium ajmalii]MBK3426761.1 helix-turn-helix transcriptional regulator [Methylobacterium ajmalii]MBZ6415364.1 helix-turn-helix transcriptional regulator [Methylobacterium sp.]